MDSNLVAFREFIIQFGFFPIISIVVLVGAYIFWREAKLTKKDGNSVFDMFLILLILVIVGGRVSYILANPSEFAEVTWFWSPYERYSDGFYLFRLLPWKYFRVWDGGYLYTASFASFILAGFMYSSIVKKWKWKHMMNVIYTPAMIMLSLTLFLSGLFSQSIDVLYQGVHLGSIVLVYLVASTIVKRMGKAGEKFRPYIVMFFVAIATAYVVFTLLSSDVTAWDRINIYILGATTIVSIVAYLIDVNKVVMNIETVTNIRGPTIISTNQPVKMRRREGDR